jgi:hypothetical protein
MKWRIYSTTVRWNCSRGRRTLLSLPRCDIDHPHNQYCTSAGKKWHIIQLPNILGGEVVTTTDEAFRVFLTRLTPSQTETEAAKSRRKSIEDCLTTNFEMMRFFRSGSFGSGTSVRGYSDVDYFASIPKKYLNPSSIDTFH